MSINNWRNRGGTSRARLDGVMDSKHSVWENEEMNASTFQYARDI